MVRWINRVIELLWLLVVFLVPLVFVNRGDMLSVSTIAYLEVPKIAILRTLVGLIAILWLIEWGIRQRISPDFGIPGNGVLLRPREWLPRLANWLNAQPTRWVLLAVALFSTSTILGTILSASFKVSMWGEVPGEDGYATYTIIAYIVLFAAVATHLKTKPQLWRLLAAISATGTLVAVYGILQHYGYDPVDLTDPPNTLRSTSTLGNPILAASVLLLTTSITFLLSIAWLQRPVRSAGFWWRLVLIDSALCVQVLGIVFTSSRGPWGGSLLALAIFFALALVFLRWRLIVSALWILTPVLVFSAAVLLITTSPSNATDVSTTSLSNTDGVPTTIPSSASNELTEAEGVAPAAVDNGSQPEVNEVAPIIGAVNRLSAAVDLVEQRATARGLSGRVDIWKDSWRLIVDRPWFGFENLNFDFLRPTIGYGPDMFRYTYLLESTPRGVDFVVPGPAHAHNYFVHQAVELGFLGLFSSIVIYASPLLVSGYILLRRRKNNLPVYGLALIGVVAIVVGRGFEQMTGIARVSDLTIFWVLLGAFVAVPLVMGE